MTPDARPRVVRDLHDWLRHILPDGHPLGGHSQRPCGDRRAVAPAWPAGLPGRAPTPSSAARAERLYPRVDIDTKNPCCVEWAMASRPRKGRREVQSPSLPEANGFRSLSKTEQVRYLQALWDSISARPDEIPVPESHLNLAEERLAEYPRDPSRARPAREVPDRLTNPDR